MPGIAKFKETTGFYCCCFKKSAPKVPSECKISCTQLQETVNVPYSSDVPKDLSTGSTICISGTIKSKCTRFTVDLLCKKETNSDIAFHFNARMDRHYIVRNSRVNNRWGVEEAASTTKCDFIRGEKFEIVYLITNNSYMVSINGKHFCEFKFRVALNLVTHLEVLGDVDIYDVLYKNWDIYPEIKPDVPPLVIGVGDEHEQPKELLGIPCTAHLPKGFEVGWQLEIYGRVKLLPHSFYINLQDGAQMWPHPIIPLHLNPRFKCVSGENIIVRNAWVNGQWGPEERPPGFPLSPGASFSIAIRNDSDHFGVWINGQLAGEFRFRVSSEKINTLYIEGDVVLKHIVMYDKFVELRKPDVEVIKL